MEITKHLTGYENGCSQATGLDNASQERGQISEPWHKHHLVTKPAHYNLIG